MATHHGKDAVVHVGGTSIGKATGYTVDTTHDIVEDTALGNSMKSYVVGRGTFTASIDMNFDDDDTAQGTLLQGSSLSFEFMPEGSSSGEQKLSGTGIVTGMSVGVTLDGVTTRTVSIQGNGGLTIGTV
ncbi:Phage major tail protein 2 [uncultured Mediterranean phage uvMED]|nr:Phage major tail protein 2 [uncultured Mediterranean phage uvMED]BAQ90948.1 Phage major tail protein 2 [uncultured Mediterranean phage uvMED]